MQVGVETLDNGLRAAFVNMPHFRTTSARLLIHSGALHEQAETAGAAHFLEHVTFQGTDALPTEKDVHEFSETNGLTHNAFTSKPNIRYVVDGYDPKTVGHLITQLAFFPSLKPETLERERNPIVDELRGYASAPNFRANIAHSRAVRGDLYARPIGGSIEDVLKMTPDSLATYHRLNYRLGNAVLIMCSGESVEKQREVVQTLLGQASDNGPSEPVKIVLPNFNPENQASSLQLIDLPLEAQTNIGIDYGFPPVDTLRELYTYNILGAALSKTANRRLRGELGLCYGVSGGTYRLSDLHFGGTSNWAHAWFSANLNGQDSVTALDAMYKDVLQTPISEYIFETIKCGLKRNVDHVLEGNPAQTANVIGDCLAMARQDEIDFEDAVGLAQTLSVNDLRKLQEEMTAAAPLVTATSPNPSVLKKVGEWASNLS